MPEISRFFGIVIKVFYDDHNPPHFHAEYGNDVALIDIRTLAVFSGRLPPRVTGLVIEWDPQQQPIHVVWGIPKDLSSPAVVVTAYRPNADVWSEDFMRRKV